MTSQSQAIAPLTCHRQLKTGTSGPVKLALSWKSGPSGPRKAVNSFGLQPLRHYFSAGGTYSFGFADPSPKKN